MDNSIAKRFQITEYCHELVRSFAPEEPELCIDATAGNGGDTVFLAQLAGEGGRVLAFDIQQRALDRTKEQINMHGLHNRVELILDTHANMDKYTDGDRADVVMFNFGYLPGGDHSIATRPESSLEAVKKALEILKTGGLLSLCIYSGGDTGFEERERLLNYLKELDQRKFIVITNEYLNRKNHPPMPVFVVKTHE